MLKFLGPSRLYGFGVVNGGLVETSEKLRSDRGARSSGERERLSEDGFGVDRHHNKRNGHEERMSRDGSPGGQPPPLSARSGEPGRSEPAGSISRTGTG